MKKIYTIGLAIAAVAALASCAKDNSVEKISNEQKITVQTNFEGINIPGSKVTINEDDVTKKFHLNWDGDETFIVYNSKNNKGGGSNVFSISSHSGANASFTGTPSDAGSGTANYIATFNYAQSVDNSVRADLPATQTYSADGAIANNCLLIARTDDVTASNLNTFDFKTMNAFMKFSLKKGSKAAGSSNSYEKMYVQSITVETVADGEVLAGRFGFNKKGTWGSEYNEVIDANKASAVTLNCVTATLTDGVELNSSTDTDFYVALAFGTFTKGLKVTVLVKNEADKMGKYVRTISNGNSYEIARNTLVAMPSLIVSPDDYVPAVICWSEDWTGATTASVANDSAKPSACGSTGTTVYGGGSVTYSESTNKVYVRNENNAGGDKPELMITSGETWTIANIPTAGKSTLYLTYASNNTKSSVTCSTVGASISGSPKSYTITTGGAASITLTFTCSGNTRIDNVVLKDK